jgi:hypothetical protein
MAYAGDLKSPDAYASCGFDPHPGHHSILIGEKWVVVSPLPACLWCTSVCKRTSGSRLQALAKSAQISFLVEPLRPALEEPARFTARNVSRITLTEVLGFRVLQVSLDPVFYPAAKCGVIALA